MFLLNFFALFFINTTILGINKNDVFWSEETKLLFGSEIPTKDDFNPALEQMIDGIIEDSNVLIKNNKLYWAHNSEIVKTSSQQERTAKNYHYFAGNNNEYYSYLFDGKTLKISPRYVSLEQDGWEFIIYHSHLSNLVDKKNIKFAACAGEILLNDEGKIKFLSNRSGHFKSTGQQFSLFINFLKEKDVLADKLNIEYWNIEKVEQILDISTQARGYRDTAVKYTNKKLETFLNEAKQFFIDKQEEAFPTLELKKIFFTKNNPITFEIIMQNSNPKNLLKHMINNRRNLKKNLNTMLEFLGVQEVTKKDIFLTLINNSDCILETLNFIENNLSSDEFYNFIKENKFLLKKDYYYLNLIKKLSPKIYSDKDLTLFIVLNEIFDDVLSVLDKEPDYKNLMIGLENNWQFIDSSKRDEYIKKLIPVLKEKNEHDKALQYASSLSSSVEAFYESMKILTKKEEFYSYSEFASEFELKSGGLLINESSEQFIKILFDTYSNILSGKDKNTIITYQLRDKSFFPSFYYKTASVKEMVIYHLLNTLIFCGGNFSKYNLRVYNDEKLVNKYLDLLSAQAKDYLLKIKNIFGNYKINEDFIIYIPTNQMWAFKGHYYNNNLYKLPVFANGDYFKVVVNNESIQEAIKALERGENHALLLALGALPKRLKLLN